MLLCILVLTVKMGLSMSKQNLVRKQYLMSAQNISKLDQLARQQGTSSAQIVRLAIDAYDPDNQVTLEEEKELMNLVSSRLQEAIADTRATRQRLEQTLARLSLQNDGFSHAP